jgi:hypothetical protein
LDTSTSRSRILALHRDWFSVRFVSPSLELLDVRQPYTKLCLLIEWDPGQRAEQGCIDHIGSTLSCQVDDFLSSGPIWATPCPSRGAFIRLPMNPPTATDAPATRWDSNLYTPVCCRSSHLFLDSQILDGPVSTLCCVSVRGWRNCDMSNIRHALLMNCMDGLGC